MLHECVSQHITTHQRARAVHEQVGSVSLVDSSIRLEETVSKEAMFINLQLESVEARRFKPVAFTEILLCLPNKWAH
jgi:hypothetical protein